MEKSKILKENPHVSMGSRGDTRRGGSQIKELGDGKRISGSASIIAWCEKGMTSSSSETLS